jgi:hypothetical protein
LSITVNIYGFSSSTVATFSLESTVLDLLGDWACIYPP